MLTLIIHTERTRRPKEKLIHDYKTLSIRNHCRCTPWRVETYKSVPAVIGHVRLHYEDLRLPFPKYVLHKYMYIYCIFTIGPMDTDGGDHAYWRRSTSVIKIWKQIWLFRLYYQIYRIRHGGIARTRRNNNMIIRVQFRAYTRYRWNNNNNSNNIIIIDALFSGVSAACRANTRTQYTALYLSVHV